MKLIAIYRKPADEAAFMAHYETVHTPLVRKIPGLRSLAINKVSQHLLGPDQPYMIVEMSFADRAVFDIAMASDENKAAGKDAMAFAGDIVSLVVAQD